MKRNKIFLYGVACIAVSLTSCSDKFLQEKKNYDKVTSEVFNDYEGAKLRVNTIYGQCLPNPSGVASWENNCTGIASDDQSKVSEEYAGFSIFNNPTNELNSTVSSLMVPDYFQNEQKHLSNVWGRIRGINDAINGFNNSSLPEDQKKEMLGQCYFFRAWCYYNLVKWYGGVPIIKEVQETEAGSFTQRSSAHECIDFILEDLDLAAEYLMEATVPGGWKESDWGRVTSGTALALKGRVLVLWASPLFNRKNDESRWVNAYKEMKEDLDIINACGYGLYKEADDINASSFAHMFAMRKSSEAVFVTLHNTIDGATDEGYNNQWERYIRPINTQLRAGSGQDASSMIVDLFPMKDGKMPKRLSDDDDAYQPAETYKLLEKSTEYDAPHDYPFMNRDPRFYRTFAFPGVRWAYNGDASQGGQNYNPSDGANYALWNYVWYASTEEQIDPEKGTRYGADNLLSSVRGIYVRKRTDDLDVNSPMYSYDTGASNGAFTYSGAPYMEIRYAEVLLNLAEAACMAGQMSDAVGYLQQIRERVGYTADNNYGLQANLTSSQPACMSAILYERMVELAYEGKRFDDLRRWMLFDGGSEISTIEGAPSSWTLSGKITNTCTWLGITPLNGQRRERMEFRVSDYYATTYGTGGNTYADDPLKIGNVVRCEPIDLRKDLSAQQDVLKAWYQEYLKRVDKGGDGYINHIKQYPHFFAKYYFLGLSLGAQNRNDERLLQTIGWENNKAAGANGTFDPLDDSDYNPAE